MTLTSGTKLGPYEILSLLGSGGMGEVYRARDTRLGRDVAIKALPEGFASDPERLARFEREARLLASLNHPNVAGIHGIEEVNGHRYLVLEFVDGETLAERLTRGPLALEEALEVCRDIAAGVEAAHESGVIHRDLKPGNVIIASSGTVKVLDFGLATSGGGSTSGSDPNLSHSPTMTHQATRAGVVLGTAAYMSPEQARGKAVDRRTDIWSFGCVLYECLSGKPLFEGETVSDLIARILERDPNWNALPATTPTRVRELLKRCLRKDGKERLRDIGDARLELSEVIAHPDYGLAAAAGAPVARSRTSRLSWIIAALAVVAAAAAFFMPRPAPDPLEQKTMRLSMALPSDLTVSTESPDVTLSPDGSTALIAAADSTGTSHLYVRPLNALSPRILPSTDGAVIPFWSPDSKQIAFFADGSLKRMGINDDGAQVICPAPAPRGGDWGLDNVIVFAPAASGLLMQVPASGGTPTPATTLDASAGETAHRFPQFLPDGKHFLYVALPGKDNVNATRVGTLDAKIGPVVLMASGRATYAAPGYVLFNQNGSILAQPFDANTLELGGSPAVVRGLKDASGQYSGSPMLGVSRDGVLVQREVQESETRLVLVDRTGRSVRQLALPEGIYEQMRFSPDGLRLALTLRKNGVVGRVWLVDLARNVATRFAFEGNFDVEPIWTADGTRIMWGSDRADGRNLYWKNSDGSGKEELLFDAPGLFNDPNSTAADVLVFRSLSGETNEDIWMVPLSGERAGKPLIATRFNENDAALSPDGRWMAYRSDESGRMEVYVTSFPSLDQRVQVSRGGSTPGTTTTFTLIRWRKDGRELYYLGPDARSVMAVPVDMGETLHAGQPRALFKVPRETVDADIAPDGQTLVLSIPVQEGRRSIITVIMNWSQELAASK